MSKLQKSPQAVSGQRDAGGRFAKGNRGGPGNPYAKQTAALRKELLACVTPAEIRQLAANLLKWANQGNLAAAKLLLSYTLGKPPAAAELMAAELDAVDLEEPAPSPNGGNGVGAPSSNGDNGERPSANGCIGEALPNGDTGPAPLANGENGRPPLANGGNGVEAPSPNAENGRPPSANGCIGEAPLPNGINGPDLPSPNRSIGERPLPNGDNGPAPIANGGNGESPSPNGPLGAAPLPNGSIGAEPLANGVFGPELADLADRIGNPEDLSLAELTELLVELDRYQTALSATPGVGLPASPSGS